MSQEFRFIYIDAQISKKQTLAAADTESLELTT